MLEVGNGGMKRDEYRTHMALWALLAAPLLAEMICGICLPKQRAPVEHEVLAVDQDAKAYKASCLGGRPLEIWVKRSPTESRCGLFNRSESATQMTLDFKSIGAPASAKLRDLLDHKDLGIAQNSTRPKCRRTRSAGESFQISLLRKYASRGSLLELTQAYPLLAIAFAQEPAPGPTATTKYIAALCPHS